MAADIAAHLEDFVAWEERQAERYELVGGVVTMMTGARWGHGRLLLRAGAAILSRIDDRRCEIAAESVKIATPRGDFLYPDLVVACGDTPVPTETTVFDRPTAIIEVLSPATERRDRGIKREAYFTIPSLRHYLLLSAELVLAELFSRESEAAPWQHAGVWTEREQAVPLTALGIALPLGEVYAGLADNGEGTLPVRQ